MSEEKESEIEDSIENDESFSEDLDNLSPEQLKKLGDIFGEEDSYP